MTDNVFSLADRRAKNIDQKAKQAEAERIHREQQESVRISNQNASAVNHEQKAAYAMHQRSARQLTQMLLPQGMFISSDVEVERTEGQTAIKFKVGNGASNMNVAINITPDIPDA